MAVRYITVTPVTKLFKPATRAFGDIAIVGTANANAIGPLKTPIPITNPDGVIYSAKTSLTAAIDAATTTVPIASLAGFPTGFPYIIRIENEQMRVTAAAANSLTVTRSVAGTTAAPHAIGLDVVYSTRDKAVDDPGSVTDGLPPTWFQGNLGAAVRKAFEQTPGPTTIWAVRANDAADFGSALDVVDKLDVQIVLLANTPLISNAVGRTEVELLSSRVNTVSKTGGDGKERIGVAMLGKDLADPTQITGNMSNSRMVMVAHKSTEDAAAAVAGTIAGYEPHISLLLKPVSISMDTLFSDAEMDALNNARINWLTDPSLIPGKGLFMGEGYTLGADIPYIDITRTIDDCSFRLKAALIRSIGDLRVSRSGLRTLVSQITAVLEPLKQREVIESYEILLPLLVLLDKDPGTLTDAELQEINNAQNARVVDAIVAVDYAGAIHRLNITLKFE